MSDNSTHNNNPGLKPRRSTDFQLSFPTMPSLQRKPMKVELHQKQYHHDVLSIIFPITGELWFNEIVTGLPVKFKWSQGSIANEWYGYVSHVSKNVVVQREKTMEVHCVGSSFPLKERTTRTFTDSTITEAAKIIADEYGFAFIGDSHPRRFSQLIMAGHSHWEWLQEQAKRIGYGLRVDGSTMYFRSLDNLIDQDITSIPLLYMGETQSVYRGQFKDRTLDSFTVLKGDYIENTDFLRTEKYAAGVDPLTSQVIGNQSSPKDVGENIKKGTNDVLFKEYRTDQVVGSDLDAVTMSEGAAQMARLNMPAKVKAQGDPRVRPFHPVYVRGTGTLTDGYWVVKEAKHIFQKFGDYHLEMVVVTDGTGGNDVGTFRGRKSPDMNTINISEKLKANNQGQVIIPVLSQTKTAILPSDQGFKQTPAVWTAVVR